MKKITFLLFLAIVLQIDTSGQISSGSWGVSPSTPTNVAYIKGGEMGQDLTINSPTLVDLPNIAFDVKAGEKWYFKVHLIASQLDASADLKGQWNCNSCDGRVTMSNIENAVARNMPPNVESNNIPVATSNLNNGDGIYFEGIVNGITDDTISFQIRNNAGTVEQIFDNHSGWIAIKIN